MKSKIAFSLKRTMLRDPLNWLASRKFVRKTLHQWGLSPLGHSTLIWFREDPNCHTRVTLRNYLTMNYKIPNPTYRFELFDGEDGQRIHRWQVTARPDETLVVDSASLSKELGLASPFDGTLGIEVRNPSLVPRRFLRANVDYYRPAHFNTTVHDQGCYVTYSRKDQQTLVYVIEDDAYETGIVLQNGYRYRKDPSEFTARVTIDLLNDDGAATSTTAPPIPSCGMRMIWLKDLFPNIRQFLDGRPGGLRLHSNIAMPRSIPIIRSKRNGFLSVNHTVGDMDPELYARAVLASSDIPREAWAPIWSSLVLETEEYQTAFSFFNNWLPRSTYSLDVRLYDMAGNRVVSVPHAFQVSPQETRVLEIQDFLAAHGIRRPFVGSIEARLTPRDDLDHFPGPGIPPVNTIWRTAQSLTLSNNQSLWVANSSLAVDDALMAPRRTRMFGRVVSNSDCETWLALINLSSDKQYSTASKTQIIVTQASGEKRIEREITIPGHGTFFGSLDDVLPELGEFLRDSDGVSSLLVVDKQVKLIGYLFLRNRSSGAIGADHLFGG